MKALILVPDQFLYFLDSKFTIKILAANTAGPGEKKTQSNRGEKSPEETMAIDQKFGERGGISGIRFISFLATLTFPFAHFN